MSSRATWWCFCGVAWTACAPQPLPRVTRLVPPARSHVAVAPIPSASTPAPSEAAPAPKTEPVQIGANVQLVAVEESESFANCSYSLKLPQLSGVGDKGLEKALNQRLRELGSEGAQSFCEGVPVSDFFGAGFAARNYSVTAIRPPLVGLRFDYEMAAGGAHGIHGTDCYVVDTSNGQSFTVVEKLGQPQRARLGQLLNEVKRAHPDVRAIEASGAGTADLTVTEQSALCWVDGGLQYQTADYELGGYAFGRPSFELPATQVRSLFDTALSRALFAQ